MNIMAAAVVTSRNFSISPGTGDSALFVVYFAAAGFLLLTAAGLVLRREESERAAVRLRSVNPRR